MNNSNYLTPITEERKITLVSPNHYYTYQFTIAPDYQYVVGRADSAVGFYPKVDLSELGAYQMGVSRMHATLELVDGDLIVTDHSSNGTVINGERIEKNIRHTVHNNSMIGFGELNFHVLIHREGQTGQLNLPPAYTQPSEE